MFLFPFKLLIIMSLIKILNKIIKFIFIIYYPCKKEEERKLK